MDAHLVKFLVFSTEFSYPIVLFFLPTSQTSAQRKQNAAILPRAAICWHSGGVVFLQKWGEETAVTVDDKKRGQGRVFRTWILPQVLCFSRRKKVNGHAESKNAFDWVLINFSYCWKGIAVNRFRRVWLFVASLFTLGKERYSLYRICFDWKKAEKRDFIISFWAGDPPWSRKPFQSLQSVFQTKKPQISCKSLFFISGGPQLITINWSDWRFL